MKNLAWHQRDYDLTADLRHCKYLNVNLSKTYCLLTVFYVFLPQYLFLPQDDDSSRFDWMPGCQVIAAAPLLTILVRVPLAVSRGPGDANVVPPSIARLQWQLGNLRSTHQSVSQLISTSLSVLQCFGDSERELLQILWGDWKPLALSLMSSSIGLLPHSISTISLAWPGTP